MDIAVVIGNPKRAGRTTLVAEAVAQRVAGAIPGPHSESTFELADVAGELFQWDAPAVTHVSEAVAAADLVVFASPTYKASFTGLLKAFLDRYSTNGLSGVVAIPVMLGAAPVHQLAVETQLRPVLVELAASLPTKGVFVIDTQLDQLHEAIEDWWRLASLPLLRALSPSQAETASPPG
jgi:FMN reductase